MEGTAEDLNYDYIQQFLKEHESILKMDKMSLLLKENIDSNLPNRINGTNQDHKVQTNIEKSRAQSKEPYDKTKDIMVKGASGGYVVVNSRENEKDKLINVLSVPKSIPSCPRARERCKRDTAAKSKPVAVVNTREREKDRLAAIFASSGCDLSKPSNYQLSKNLNCGISFTKNPQKELIKSAEDLEEYKYTNAIPEVLISEYEDSIKSSQASNTRNSVSESGGRMVRIGEFSPLNPDHSAEAAWPNLGIGEYDQRRRSLNEQRNFEYNQYLQQKSHQALSNSSRGQNHNLKDVSTQTVWDEGGNENLNYIPRQFEETHPETPNSHCSSPCSSRRMSPVTKCCQGVGEKELKEQLYREELRKQIEEKNRIKEEIRRKEEEEEAKLEAKICRDQEKMRRQYEEERLQRLELAIRKREQDDLLRKKLALEMQKVQEENKTKRKSILKKSSPPKDIPSGLLPKNKASRIQPLSQSLPTTARSSKGLTDVHEVARRPDDITSVGASPKPAIEITVRPGPSEYSGGPSQPYARHQLPLATAHIDNVKSIDILVQEDYEPTLRKTAAEKENYALITRSIRDKVAEAERVTRDPLVTESYRVLPPMSPPLLHATVPPVAPSRSPPIPTARHQRTNTDLLDDKWKVPHTEETVADVHAKHNRHVLTQLGAFRRQLQQERLRLRQQAADDGL